MRSIILSSSFWDPFFISLFASRHAPDNRHHIIDDWDKPVHGGNPLGKDAQILYCVIRDPLVGVSGPRPQAL